MTTLATTFCGLSIKNPLILGAGPLSGTAERIKKCIDAGYGAVITKTSSQFEYYHKFPFPRYTLVGYEKAERGKANRDWFWFHNDHNSPVDPMKFATIIKDSAGYAKEKGCLLIGSYAASNLEEWARCGEAYQKAGADIIELNFCCAGPAHLQDVVKQGDLTALYGELLGRNVDLAVKVVKAVKEAVSIPILCKLPPGERYKSKDNAAKLYEAGAAGVELYANSKGMRVDIEQAYPVNNGVGTLNSHGHLADTMFDVAMLVRDHPQVNVIAGRGVRYWEEVVELLMAGSTVVEICTPAFVYGLSFGQEILTEMEKFMNRKGYASVDDLRGAALKKALKPSEIKEKVIPVYAQINGKRCKACGRCEEVCAYDAAKVVYKGGSGMAKIDKTKCVGCTLCSQVCPYDAIELPERTVQEYLDALYSVHPET